MVWARVLLTVYCSDVACCCAAGAGEPRESGRELGGVGVGRHQPHVSGTVPVHMWRGEGSSELRNTYSVQVFSLSAYLKILISKEEMDFTNS